MSVTKTRSHQHLYDEEVLTIYLDSSDRSRRGDDIQGGSLPCVGCFDVEWDYDVLDLSSRSVSDGPWAWGK